MKRPECFYVLAALMASLGATFGCAISSTRTHWQAPLSAPPGAGDPEGRSPEFAEATYAIAVEAEADASADCVDFFYQSAVSAWNTLQRDIAGGGVPSARTTCLYHSAVARLVITAQRFGRWNPSDGIRLSTSSGQTIVPTRFVGFTWEPHEFQCLAPVGDYADSRLSRKFRSEGLGIPLVVVRNTSRPQPFTQAQQPFAATALLRSSNDDAGVRLEFYNPLYASATCVCNRPVALAQDITAPFAWSGQDGDRLWIANFLRPGSDGSKDGLFMIEPYQCSKIPVVFVHGLLSDPETWVDLVNELRARPGLNERFQWWGFRYATGEPFLTSAAVLRRQLAEIRQIYDPLRVDPTMSQMMLIGHSMGGLIAKLQVTASGDSLWRAVAKEPLSGIRTTRETRVRLRNEFYFQPSCDVARVVYIGTPHLGSTWAERPIGRLGSALVKPTERDRDEFAQLMRDNPDLLISNNGDRFPTSVDLLEPSSSLLAATAALPCSSRVAFHSIAGVARTTLKGEPSDGVVPLSSARLYGVATERYVDAVHTRLHQHPDSIDEIECILRSHLAEFQSYQAPGQPTNTPCQATRDLSDDASIVR